MRIHSSLLFVLFLFSIYAFSPALNTLEDREKELKEIALQLINDDAKNTFLQSLRPSKEDISVLFNSDAVEAIWKYSENKYNTIPDNAISPKNSQTEVHLYSALSKDLKEGLRHELPGGYTRIAKRYKDDVIIYCLKYTEPNKPAGYSLNSFYYVGDHWVCIPKAFNAFNRN